VAVLDQGTAEGRRSVAFAAAGRAEQQEVGAFLEPAVADGERHDADLAEHRHGGEVEAVERLIGRQPGLDEMVLDAVSGPLGDFELGQGREEARGRPEPADGGQEQFVQQQGQLGGVDRSCRGLHQAGTEQGVVGDRRRQHDGDRHRQLKADLAANAG
jgi:hypothetical protein